MLQICKVNIDAKKVNFLPFRTSKMEVQYNHSKGERPGASQSAKASAGSQRRLTDSITGGNGHEQVEILF